MLLIGNSSLGHRHTPVQWWSWCVISLLLIGNRSLGHHHTPVQWWSWCVILLLLIGNRSLGHRHSSMQWWSRCMFCWNQFGLHPENPRGDAGDETQEAGLIRSPTAPQQRFGLLFCLPSYDRNKDIYIIFSLLSSFFLCHWLFFLRDISTNSWLQIWMDS